MKIVRVTCIAKRKKKNKINMEKENMNVKDSKTTDTESISESLNSSNNKWKKKKQKDIENKHPKIMDEENDKATGTEMSSERVKVLDDDSNNKKMKKKKKQKTMDIENTKYMNEEYNEATDVESMLQSVNFLDGDSSNNELNKKKKQKDIDRKHSKTSNTEKISASKEFLGDDLCNNSWSKKKKQNDVENESTNEEYNKATDTERLSESVNILDVDSSYNKWNKKKKKKKKQKYINNEHDKANDTEMISESIDILDEDFSDNRQSKKKKKREKMENESTKYTDEEYEKFTYAESISEPVNVLDVDSSYKRWNKKKKKKKKQTYINNEHDKANDTEVICESTDFVDEGFSDNRQSKKKKREKMENESTKYTDEEYENVTYAESISEPVNVLDVDSSYNRWNKKKKQKYISNEHDKANDTEVIFESRDFVDEGFRDNRQSKKKKREKMENESTKHADEEYENVTYTESISEPVNVLDGDSSNSRWNKKKKKKQKDTNKEYDLISESIDFIDEDFSNNSFSTKKKRENRENESTKYMNEEYNKATNSEKISESVNFLDCDSGNNRFNKKGKKKKSKHTSKIMNNEAGSLELDVTNNSESIPELRNLSYSNSTAYFGLNEGKKYKHVEINESSVSSNTVQNPIDANMMVGNHVTHRKKKGNESIKSRESNIIANSDDVITNLLSDEDAAASECKKIKRKKDKHLNSKKLSPDIAQDATESENFETSNSQLDIVTHADEFANRGKGRKQKKRKHSEIDESPLKSVINEEFGTNFSSQLPCEEINSLSPLEHTNFHSKKRRKKEKVMSNMEGVLEHGEKNICCLETENNALNHNDQILNNTSDMSIKYAYNSTPKNGHVRSSKIDLSSETLYPEHNTSCDSIVEKTDSLKLGEKNRNSYEESKRKRRSKEDPHGNNYEESERKRSKEDPHGNNYEESERKRSKKDPHRKRHMKQSSGKADNTENLGENSISRENDNDLHISEDSNFETDLPSNYTVCELDDNEVPVNFSIPDMHENETVSNRFYVKQKHDLESKGIKVKSGKWSKSEIALLRKNFDHFCFNFKINDPYLLLGLGQCFRKKEVTDFLRSKHFYVRLGKDLIDRPLRNIYMKARRLFCPFRGKRKCDKNDVSALKEAHDLIGNKWNQMSTLVCKSPFTLRESHRWNEKKVKKGKWTKEEETNLIEALKKVAKTSDISQNNIKNISWSEVAKLVPTRNFSQCRLHWGEHLAWHSDVNERKSWTADCLSTLIWVLKNGNFKDEVEIDWRKIHSDHFKEVAPSYMFLQKKWRKLKYDTPLHKRKNYCDLINYQYEKFFAKESDSAKNC